MIPRRGFTLIELLAVITATAAILAATVMLMHFVLQMDTEVRQRTHTVTTVGRLAEQFRRDVHQARGEPVLAANHRAAELHLPGGTIVRWRIDVPGILVRIEQAPGVAHREDSFTLPKGTTVSLELRPQGAAGIVTIQIDSPGMGGPSLAIEALASRDQRLAVEEGKP
ncbi:MAG: prepilin-type N-terminal cleavage/methylation domain-containing protein [Thermoguttaceae bacterium]